MESQYPRFVESSSVHVSEIATSCEQWLNPGMISERDFELAVAWRLRVLRAAFKKTQKEFGEKIDVGGTAVSTYEQGRAIEPYKALKLKALFGVPVEWLYSGDESALSDHLAEKLAKAERKLEAEAEAPAIRQAVKAKGRG